MGAGFDSSTNLSDIAGTRCHGAREGRLQAGCPLGWGDRRRDRRGKEQRQCEESELEERMKFVPVCVCDVCRHVCGVRGVSVCV